MHEMKKAHAEVLANIERARKEDMEAVEARHKREMEKVKVEVTRAVREGFAEAGEAAEKITHDAHRRGYAMGYAFADQKWNPVYKAVCEELELVRKEGANHEAGYIRLLKERDELILAQVDLRQELDESAEANEKLEAQAEELRKQIDDEVAAATKIFTAMRADLERLRAQNNALKEKTEGLLELVGPTQKLMASNPELFGGEARGGAPAPGEALPSGTSSPRPPAIIRLPQVKEEDTERVEKFLKGLVRPFFRDCAVVEKPSPLPGIEEAEGLCMALTGEQVEAQAAEATVADVVPVEAAPQPLAPRPLTDLTGQELRDEYHILVGKPTGQRHSHPFGTKEKLINEIIRMTSIPDSEPVAGAKPKPNYNHPNWPSPITKRFAKHLAKHSGLRSPWYSHDPKSIKTHQDALEYIAKRVNISVENLLGWTMKQYQTTYDPWTLVKGPNAFQMGTAPATWWC